MKSEQQEPGFGLEATVEKLESHKVKLEVTVGREEVDRAYHRAYRSLATRVNVPGFRRGKVPRPVLERHVGREALREEALDLILPDAYSRALDSKSIDPIDRPEVDVVKFEEGEPLVFRATVEVKPEVKLGQYTGLGIDVPPKAVEPADVEAQLDAIRERRAVLEPVAQEGTLEDGLYAVVDYHSTIDGQGFPGGDVEGALVQMGAGQLQPEIEAAIRGAKVGEERDCLLTFPADIPNERIRGRTAQVHIQVKELKRKVLPDLTDELARELTGLDLVTLRERVRQSLEEQAKRDAREELARQVVERVTAQAEIDLPEKLVQRRMERMKAETSERLASQGLDVDKYLSIVGLEKEQWEKELRARAEHRVKRDLVLEAIARREKIEASDAEIEFEIARMAAMSRQKPDRVRALFRSSPDRLDSLRAGIITDKTVQYLVRENAARPLDKDGPAKPTGPAAPDPSADEAAPDSSADEAAPDPSADKPAPDPSVDEAAAAPSPEGSACLSPETPPAAGGPRDGSQRR